jgi:hypothetical protein
LILCFLSTTTKDKIHRTKPGAVEEDVREAGLGDERELRVELAAREMHGHINVRVVARREAPRRDRLHLLGTRQDIHAVSGRISAVRTRE